LFRFSSGIRLQKGLKKATAQQDEFPQQCVNNATC